MAAGAYPGVPTSRSFYVCLRTCRIYIYLYIYICTICTTRHNTCSHVQTCYMYVCIYIYTHIFLLLLTCVGTPRTRAPYGTKIGTRHTYGAGARLCFAGSRCHTKRTSHTVRTRAWRCVWLSKTTAAHARPLVPAPSCRGSWPCLRLQQPPVAPPPALPGGVQPATGGPLRTCDAAPAERILHN